MAIKTLCLLGIPIESLDIAGTVEKILNFLDQKQGNSASRYISTLNVDFLANIHGWNWRQIRNPELLGIIRRSFIVTADGKPIVWLSYLLGCPLQERVTGADLVPYLAEVLAEKKKSIYLFGGEEKVTKKAAKYLRRINPELRIAGYTSPPIHVKGEKLLEARERDLLIVEEINRTSPDLLFVCLGHPKQEIWFERVRHHLKVPVVIGVGGSLNFLIGELKRAPVWMQSSGLEWLYRLFQEPGRLFKRYFYDAIHFLYLSTPLVLYHRLHQSFYRLSNLKDRYRIPRSLLFLSSQKSIALVKIPKILNGKNLEHVRVKIDEAFVQDAVIFDFQQTRHLDLEGLGLLLLTWNRALKEKKHLFGFGIRRHVRYLLQMHKIWDIMASDTCQTASEVIYRLPFNEETIHLYESVHQKGDTLILSFFGSLDNRQDFQKYMQKFVTMLCNKHCVLDFTYCVYIDNAGFGFLLELKHFVEKEGKTIKIKGTNKTLSQQFRNEKVDHLFEKCYSK